MDKKTEALKLALEALEAKGDAWIVLERKAKAAIRSALAEQPAQCRHRIADARNPVVKSGYLCVDCGALFAAADHTKQPAQPSKPLTGILSIAYAGGRVVTCSFKTEAEAKAFEQYAIEAANGVKEKNGG